jgi:hypothetical protein
MPIGSRYTPGSDIGDTAWTTSMSRRLPKLTSKAMIEVTKTLVCHVCGRPIGLGQGYVRRGTRPEHTACPRVTAQGKARRKA